MRQAQALTVMLSGKSIFLTGPPGAGKTFVLNEFIRRAEGRGKRVAVTASTGIAATHIGGMTIHSWSGLGVRDELTPYDKQWLATNDRLRKRYNGTDVLVIDEVSMLHGRRLDMVNEACKLLRENSAPFGGLQIILVGDLFQLPPVARGDELVDFVHMSAAWQELAPEICYLTEQHRQQGGGLLDVLNAMRAGELNDYHEEMLQERMGKMPEIDMPVTRLYAHNVDVEAINDRHLAALNSETKVYHMTTHGTASKIEQLVRSVLAPERLELKDGAEVIFVANNFAAGFVNGSRGRVVGFRDGQPLVTLANTGRTLKVEPHSWTLMEDGKKHAEVAQLPLRLAWAITIHKSQGMSLDAAEIDLSKSFTPGMGYVALSRVRTLDGLFLSGINAMALRLHPDIFSFDNEARHSSELLAAQTPDAPDEPLVTTQVVGAERDEALFVKLRAWRMERARAEAIAPFIIAHDAALTEIATHKPVSMPQLLAVKGFGAKKAAAYGEAILKIVADHTGVAPKDKNEGWNEIEDTQLLESFRAGTPLHEVAATLQRSPEEVWQRLIRVVK